MALESTAWTECVNVFRNEAWGVSMSLESKAWCTCVNGFAQSNNSLREREKKEKKAQAAATLQTPT